MSIFLALMVAGLTGLVVMALPGLLHSHVGGHDVGHIGHGHEIGAHHAGGHVAHGDAAHGHAHHDGATDGASKTWLGGLIPSPRTIFSLLALYGAFGYALSEGGYLPPKPAALAALVPAWLIERFLVTPLWNLMFRFQGRPDAPLETLVMTEAEAVTPFTNGRGIVSVIRDGRAVQFSARLPEAQAAMKVRVGDKLRIEDVDAANERLTVTLH